jgi:hypothetical protein
MRILGFVLVLAACSGDTPPNVDADPRGPMCAGSAYDNCASEHDCGATAPLCHLFQSDGFQVCTVGCTQGGPACPGGATCNDMGICKPTAANMCHL